MIRIIAAMHENRGIGISGNLIRRDSRDLERFRELTMGKVVVAGRITAETLPSLPGRKLVTLGKGQDYESVAEILEEFDGQDLWIIGGGKVYESFLPVSDEIYLTVFPGFPIYDTKFPEIPEQDWTLKTTITRDDLVKYLVYTRK